MKAVRSAGDLATKVVVDDLDEPPVRSAQEMTSRAGIVR
jgi:hypothetical protein